MKRKEAIRKIVAQAKILGHVMWLLREGEPDTNTGMDKE
jgi:hypothetical protein